MKKILFLFSFIFFLSAQTDFFYGGIGVTRAEQEWKNESSINDFENSLYFQIGSLRQYGNKFIYGFGIHGLQLRLEERYSGQIDQYSLFYFGGSGSVGYHFNEKFGIFSRTFVFNKLFNFYTNKDGTAEVRSLINHMRNFKSFFFSEEIGFRFFPEGIAPYGIEFSAVFPLSDIFENKKFRTRLRPTAKISVLINY
jgi:hypothetical protein